MNRCPSCGWDGYDPAYHQPCQQAWGHGFEFEDEVEDDYPDEPWDDPYDEDDPDRLLREEDRLAGGDATTGAA